MNAHLLTTNLLNSAIVELSCLPTGLPSYDLYLAANDNIVVWDSETGEVSTLRPIGEPVYVNVERLMVGMK